MDRREVIKHYRLPRPVWIEHYPPEATKGSTDAFDFVLFDSYEVREVPVGGEEAVLRARLSKLEAFGP